MDNRKHTSKIILKKFYYWSLTAPFWVANRRIDGARATEEAAAAAATRILQQKHIL
jgi:hypothetical protein